MIGTTGFCLEVGVAMARSVGGEVEEVEEEEEGEEDLALALSSAHLAFIPETTGSLVVVVMAEVAGVDAAAASAAAFSTICFFFISHNFFWNGKRNLGSLGLEGAGEAPEVAGLGLLILVEVGLRALEVAGLDAFWRLLRPISTG